LPPAVNGEEGIPVTPITYALNQNYPNPFNSSTVIHYQLPVTEWVMIKVYDMLGQEVAMLINEVRWSGEHSVRWDAGDNPNGVYYYQLTAGAFTETKKMILMK